MGSLVSSTRSTRANVPRGGVAGKGSSSGFGPSRTAVRSRVSSPTLAVQPFVSRCWMKTCRLFFVIAAVGIFSLVARAADWPQWRGPERNGISQETGLLKEWPKEGPKLLWQVKDIGFGYSSP